LAAGGARGGQAGTSSATGDAEEAAATRRGPAVALTSAKMCTQQQQLLQEVGEVGPA